MKLRHHFTLALAISATAFSSLTFAADAGFKSIFNGKDLSGWDGLKPFWSVRDGAITGQTKSETDLPGNTFLVYKSGEPANFELRLKFKLTAQNDKSWANSGVQYRSKIVDPAGFVVAGYQADMDNGRYIGMLYEEKGRGILMQPGQKIRVSTAKAVGAKADSGKKNKQSKASIETLATVTTPEQLAAAYKFGEWSDLVIIAQGNHVQHFVNGKLTADVTDEDAANAPKSGVIALQLHRGPPMTVQFKDLQIKLLP